MLTNTVPNICRNQSTNQYSQLIDLSIGRKSYFLKEQQDGLDIQLQVLFFYVGSQEISIIYGLILFLFTSSIYQIIVYIMQLPYTKYCISREVKTHLARQSRHEPFFLQCVRQMQHVCTYRLPRHVSFTFSLCSIFFNEHYKLLHKTLCWLVLCIKGIYSVTKSRAIMIYSVRVLSTKFLSIASYRRV